jgi:hypothetical protein
MRCDVMWPRHTPAELGLDVPVDDGALREAHKEFAVDFDGRRLRVEQPVPSDACTRGFGSGGAPSPRRLGPPGRGGCTWPLLSSGQGTEQTNASLPLVTDNRAVHRGRGDIICRTQRTNICGGQHRLASSKRQPGGHEAWVDWFLAEGDAQALEHSSDIGLCGLCDVLLELLVYHISSRCSGDMLPAPSHQRIPSHCLSDGAWRAAKATVRSSVLVELLFGQ